MSKVRVTQKVDEEVPVDVLATDIQKIAASVEALKLSRLKWSTIVLLVSRSAGVGMKDTAAVLEASADLAREYLKSETKVAR